MFFDHSAHYSRRGLIKSRGGQWEDLRSPASPAPEIVVCDECLSAHEAAELRGGLCKPCRRAAR